MPYPPKKEFYDNRLRYWTKSLQAGEQRKKEVTEQKTLKRNVGLILLGFMIICFVVLVDHFYKKSSIKDTGVRTKATITNIQHDKYTMNELELNNVNHYLISYEFKVSNNKYQGICEISNDEYNSYFDSTLKVGDVITIKYLPDSPKKSEILNKNY